MGEFKSPLFSLIKHFIPLDIKWRKFLENISALNLLLLFNNFLRLDFWKFHIFVSTSCGGTSSVMVRRSTFWYDSIQGNTKNSPAKIIPDIKSRDSNGYKNLFVLVFLILELLFFSMYSYFPFLTLNQLLFECWRLHLQTLCINIWVDIFLKCEKKLKVEKRNWLFFRKNLLFHTFQCCNKIDTCVSDNRICI